MVYRFKNGSMIKASAQVAGEMCDRLSKEEGGLTPKRLLDANRDENAPLHNEFEWNDLIAAEAYRENQAAHIIRCLVIEPEQNLEEKPSRAFVRVTEEKHSYTPLRVVMEHPDMMKILMENAKRDMQYFIDKYQALGELEKVINSMNEVLEEAS